MVVVDSFCDYVKLEQRNFKFPLEILKGVILGIKTSEFDKKQIVEELLLHSSEVVENFQVYQADFNENSQAIIIREKYFWILER